MYACVLALGLRWKYAPRITKRAFSIGTALAGTALKSAGLLLNTTVATSVQNVRDFKTVIIVFIGILYHYLGNKRTDKSTIFNFALISDFDK